jgi:hypothetical protein
VRDEKTIKVKPGTKKRFDQIQRELAVEWEREVGQDDTLNLLLRFYHTRSK